MKPHVWILMIIVAAVPLRMAVAACAPDEISAGSAPEGNVQVAPDQRDGQKQVVAVGKSLTFTAGGLKDKDCWCGDEVSDTINTTTGVKWVINQGTLAGGNTGTPKTWTAPKNPVTNLGLRLQVDDDATAQHTTNDGGFTEVASLNVDVVIPNQDSWAVIAGACRRATVGVVDFLLDRVSYQACVVDFSGLQIREGMNAIGFTINTCGIRGLPSTGTAWTPIGAGNTAVPVGGAAGNDRHAVCSSPRTRYPPACYAEMDNKWWVRAPAGSAYGFFTRRYKWYGPIDGGNATGFTLGRVIISYP